MLRLKISVATVDVLWQNIVGISISAAALNEKAEERVPSEDGKPRILGDALGLRSTSLAIKHIISSSSSKPVLIVIFWSLLVLPVGLLDVREAHPGRVRLTSLKTTLFSISLWLRLKEGDAGDGLRPLGIDAAAAADLAAISLWYRQRNEPGWLVGEHIHVVFFTTGAEAGDFLDTRVEEGSRLSGDKERRSLVPSLTDRCLEAADKARGRNTAFNRFEAFIFPRARNSLNQKRRTPHQNLSPQL